MEFQFPSRFIGWVLRSKTIGSGIHALHVRFVVDARLRLATYAATFVLILATQALCKTHGVTSMAATSAWTGLAVAAVFMPLVLVDFHASIAEKVTHDLRKRIVDWTSVAIESRAERVSEDGPGFADELLRTLRQPTSQLVIASRLFPYFCSHRWQSEVQATVADGKVKAAIMDLASQSQELWDALVEHQAEVDIIAPHTHSHRVLERLKKRSEDLRLQGLLPDQQSQAMCCVTELARERRKRRLVTRVHQAHDILPVRMMITDSVCYLQQFPKADVAVAQPVYRLERVEHPAMVALFESLTLAIGKLGVTRSYRPLFGKRPSATVHLDGPAPAQDLGRATTPRRKTGDEEPPPAR